MRQRYNEESVDLKANVARFLSQELCTDEYDERGVLGHSILEYGEEVAEFFNSHEKKPKHAWEQWWEEQGREQVEDYGNPRLGTRVIGETQVVAFPEDVYDTLEEQMKRLRYGFGKNDHSRFLTALLIRHRDEIKGDEWVSINRAVAAWLEDRSEDEMDVAGALSHSIESSGADVAAWLEGTEGNVARFWRQFYRREIDFDGLPSYRDLDNGTRVIAVGDSLTELRELREELGAALSVGQLAHAIALNHYADLEDHVDQ